MSFLYPFTGSAKVTSAFGSRTAPTSGATTNHAGVDFGVPVGTDILSAITGRVTETGYNSSRGNYIVISDDGGVSVLYQHANNILAKQGDTIRQGQVIAKSGNTGTTTGPHLHMELKINGKNVDPLLYLQNYDQINSADSSAGSFNLPDLDGITEVVKKYWYLIAGGLIVFALFDKLKD